ncbi:type II toxin-antitoxin system RatA family toxin [Streptomyces sp. N50]|uniref:type II toxin-antitoxin system RatA family toxin n=1 Tax=Streptomyces sp. N50 TaxID=3081765 RepID=UPI0029624ED7|nr:SRPBCC family protein [Streptomyces sp. N50]WOX09482.1 SRPBCC family protein [Streptomyces sp. N50]
MPRVEVELPIAVPPETAWAAVVDVEAFPACMDSVDSVTITRRTDDRHRTSAWAVRLKGSVLQWTEDEVLDPVARRFDFRQVTGDLGEFVGHWAVRPAPGGHSTVCLDVTFDIGIPLLADLLNPVAADALRENAAQMLSALERQLLAADAQLSAPLSVPPPTREAEEEPDLV